VARRKLRLTSLPGFERDVYALPDMRTRKMALDMLAFLRDGRVQGVALGQHVKTGDLSDCYKFYFDPQGTGKPRFRLVYRFTPNEIKAIALEAVAVGERADLDVYLRAADRLGRTPFQNSSR
jgi:hypothetical protein